MHAVLARKEMPPQPLSSASAAVEDKSVGWSARISESVPWTSQCLDGDCALGRTAADALCAWASRSGAATATACLVPSRFLGGGMKKAGIAGWQDLTEVLPPHMLTTVTMRASHVRAVLVRGQKEAWQDCPVLASGWQISGLRLSWCADDSATGSSADGSGNDVMRKEISAVLEECIDKVCSFA